MSDTIPSAAELASVSFISGINTAGTIIPVSFHTWNKDSPATYGQQTALGKWDNDTGGNSASATSKAGTSGGTVTYTFDPSENWTTAEQQVFIAGLTLWSDEANIKFVQAVTASSADMLISKSSIYASQYLGSFVSNGTVGSSNIPDNITKSPVPGFQPTLYFNTGGGYGVLGQWGSGGYSFTTIVHELGHALGLGHSGPYDDVAGVGSDAAQQGPYDSRLFSVMSYIDPGDTLAADFTQYPVTGTDWDITTSVTTTTGTGFQVQSTSFDDAPQTPMMDDILAAQELYGAPTVTALSGGQVFGFHCNITDAAEPFFDFTINVDPVVTLWDAGTGNTLDISGYTMDCAVDLLPGSFSSVDGLTNNIGIAFGTRIDEAIGGSGNDTFTVNADSDTIIGGAGTNTVVFSGLAADYTIETNGGTVEVGHGTTTDTLQQIQTLRFADTTLQAADFPCFRRGTHILTTTGPREVEQMRVGDNVVTCRSGELAVSRVAWIGHRRVDVRRHPWPDRVMPVRVRAGAFQDGVPLRDLWLSPDHAVFADGVLIPVKHLVNDRSIAQVGTDAVEYWHVELARHDVVLAEGLPVESYLDTGNRTAFGNGGAPLQLHPDFAASSWDDACAELVAAGPRLVAVKERLARRAGSARRPTPTLTVTAGGRVLWPERAGAGAWRLTIPMGAGEIRLCSPAWMPAACEPASLDRRRLGVRVFEVTADRRRIDLGADALTGFHPAEMTAEGLCRWTTGEAAVALPRGTRQVTLRLDDEISSPIASGQRRSA